MKRSRAGILGTALLSLALVAVACGGGDDADDRAAASTSTTAVGGTAITTSGAAGDTTVTTPGGDPTSMAGWEVLWAKQRAAIVERIEDNGWGRSADGRTLTGPEGFTIDLSSCPSGWSDTGGLTDTEIRIGQTLAQSGTVAEALYYGKGQDTILEYYSDQGVFTDVKGKTRRVDYIQKDDGYDAARTIPLVDELIDAEEVFALITLGSPNALQSYDKLNQRCVPHPMNQTGHPAWGDPVNHPWTTGLALGYTTEAVLWGAFIEERLDEFPDGRVTVAAIVEDNEFGHIYDAGFRAYLESSPNKDKIEYVTEANDPQASTIKDQMTTLASKHPDVFLVMEAGAFCTSAVVEAAGNGMHESVRYLFQPNTCAGSTSLSRTRVGGDGGASDGWWIVNGGNKDIEDPGQQSDPVVIWAREMLVANGVDPDVSANNGLGMTHGWAWAQALQIAGELDGGLTRSNLILAMRSLDMVNPFQLEGMTFRMNGNKDSYYTEGGIYQQFDVDQQTWVDRGTVVDVDGKSKNCRFDQAAGICNLY